MPRDNHAPPVLSYQTVMPTPKNYRVAGIAMVVWSCVLFLAGLIPVAVALFVTLRIVWWEEPSLEDVCAGASWALLLGFFTLVCMKSAIHLMHVSRRLFQHEPVGLERLFDVMLVVEIILYILGCGLTILLPALPAPWVSVLFAAPLLTTAAGLTFTRKILLRIEPS